MGSVRQVLAPDNIFQERDELEEGFWNYRLQQRHLDRDILAIPLPRLGLDVELE